MKKSNVTGDEELRRKSRNARKTETKKIRKALGEIYQRVIGYETERSRMTRKERQELDKRSGRAIRTKTFGAGLIGRVSRSIRRAILFGKSKKA